MTARPKLLITRPDEEQERTARAAVTAGFEPISMPLLTFEPLPFDLPAPLPGALLFTSARTPPLVAQRFPHLCALPVYAVGEHTASSATAAGFRVALAGDSDGTAILAQAHRAGERHLLHIGTQVKARYHLPEGMQVIERTAYRMQLAEGLSDEAVDALHEGALVLLMSPRTAAQFSTLCDGAGVERRQVAVVVISAAAALSAGNGWQEMMISPLPDLASCLASARELWQKGCDG